MFILLSVSTLEHPFLLSKGKSLETAMSSEPLFFLHLSIFFNHVRESAKQLGCRFTVRGVNFTLFIYIGNYHLTANNKIAIIICCLL